jgi:hypothetical protein
LIDRAERRLSANGGCGDLGSCAVVPPAGSNPAQDLTVGENGEPFAAEAAMRATLADSRSDTAPCGEVTDAAVAGGPRLLD